MVPGSGSMAGIAVPMRAEIACQLGKVENPPLRLSEPAGRKARRKGAELNEAGRPWRARLARSVSGEARMRVCAGPRNWTSWPVSILSTRRRITEPSSATATSRRRSNCTTALASPNCSQADATSCSWRSCTTREPNPAGTRLAGSRLISLNQAGASFSSGTAVCEDW